MLPAPTSVEVTITVKLDRADYQPGAYAADREYSVTRELRALVVFHSVHEGPEVDRLEKACWEELYPDEQDAAEDEAIDLALVKLEERMRRAS
jgi:hypothetical protein